VATAPAITGLHRTIINPDEFIVLVASTQCGSDSAKIWAPSGRVHKKIAAFSMPMQGLKTNSGPEQERNENGGLSKKWKTKKTA
jgi:hypothetical protein